MRLFPGIPALLAALREHGLRVGLVTGKSRPGAALALEGLDLAQCFDAVEAGSPAASNKVRSSRRVVERWGLSPDVVAYVHDVRSDMALAREAGLVPIGAAWDRLATVTGADAGLLFGSVAALAADLAGEC